MGVVIIEDSSGYTKEFLKILSLTIYHLTMSLSGPHLDKCGPDLLSQTCGTYFLFLLISAKKFRGI